MFDIRQYSPADAPVWNDFVARSKNGTFLFDRGYMDYHADRFPDCSLMVFDAAGRLAALLPASRKDDGLVSHGGLTYGGLVTDAEMTTPAMVDLFAALRRHLAERQVAWLDYKTVPAIYHRLPAEEDRFALFCHGAELSRRDVLSVIDLAAPGPVQQRRRRGARKAATLGIAIEESGAWPEFWDVLSANLGERHGRQPVHALAEITLLQGRFPDNIRLSVARQGGSVVGGAVLYLAGQTAHVQYIGSTEDGRQSGALDLLFSDLIERHAGYRYFDFGVSNEGDGRLLNRGLCEFKEGFGARAVVHDHYRLVIA